MWPRLAQATGAQGGKLSEFSKRNGEERSEKEQDIHKSGFTEDALALAEVAKAATHRRTTESYGLALPSGGSALLPGLDG
mmetsp:Transcript_89378/g.161278  ORF Transcript_89378/g.161278 Transcript_89378/m.161278 type:complete len:80 (-) Transcript_89378:56-295(-)